MIKNSNIDSGWYAHHTLERLQQLQESKVAVSR
jgi:hypothetical protein